MTTSPDPEGKDTAYRQKRTLLLLIGGIACLLLPLIWILYLKLSEPQVLPTGLSASDIFTKRGGNSGEAGKISPAASAAAPMAFSPAPPLPSTSQEAALPAPNKAAATQSAAGQDSMAFIRGGQDYQEKTPPPQPQVQAGTTTPPPPPPIPAPQPAARQKSSAKTAAKPSPKPLVMPKLQGWSGPTAFGHNKPQKAAPQSGALPQGSVAPAAAGLVPQGAGGLPDMSQLMKNLPAGAQLPQGMPGLGSNPNNQSP